VTSANANAECPLYRGSFVTPYPLVENLATKQRAGSKGGPPGLAQQGEGRASSEAGQLDQ
jgi:hypothetical protein